MIDIQVLEAKSKVSLIVEEPVARGASGGTTDGNDNVTLAADVTGAIHSVRDFIELVDAVRDAMHAESYELVGIPAKYLNPETT